jgi:hypothetical protein
MTNYYVYQWDPLLCLLLQHVHQLELLLLAEAALPHASVAAVVLAVVKKECRNGRCA